MQAKQLDFIGTGSARDYAPEQFTLWHETEKETEAGHFDQPFLPSVFGYRDLYATDYSKVDALFNSFDSDEVERYKTYWESIKPQNDTEVFRRWLFAFMSVHTSWESNVRGYEAVKDWTKWVNRDDELERLLVESRVGLHKNRTRFLSQFAHKFWNDPDWYKFRGGNWQFFRDRLVKNILGLGIAKVSFALEMIYPNETKVTCMDTHLFQAFNLDQTKDARNYKLIEKYWLDMCGMWNVPSTIARAIYWDRKQGKTDSRYWSYVLEG